MGQGRGWRFGSHLNDAFRAMIPPPASPSHRGLLGQAGSPVLDLDFTALTMVAEGKSILGEEEMVGREGSLWLKLP